MGHALDALSDVAVLLQHNPIIAGVAVVAGALSAASWVLLGFLPGGSILNGVLVAPLFLSGMLALVYAGRDGTASVEDFLDGIREHYTTLVVASVISTALVTGLVMQFLGVAMAVLGASLLGTTMGSGLAGGTGGSTAGVGGSAAGTGATTGAATGVGTGLLGAGAAFALLLLALVVFVIVLAMIFQFVDVAVVVGNESVLGAVAESWSVFRTAPVSVFGYTLLRGLAVLVALGLPLAVVFVANLPVGLSSPVAIGLLAVTALLFVPLSYLFGVTYHVAFYNRIRATT